ncbi:hypothetical protein [Amycolatopsis sp. NPDC051903]|uniref:hypothetical protein n=1 Tax=Amycolatopsis sp. NPDC051903 TaxID=3363936 RepID=UPI0037AEBF72
MYEAPGAGERRRDPWAVAVGNASFLGVGYLLLGRWLLAALNVIGTVVLAVLLVTAFPAVWFEIVVLVWWAGGILHGWLVAGGPGRGGGPWWQWVAAGAVTVPVLLVAALVRIDATAITGEVDAAKAAGDCPRATRALDRVWFGHRLVDAPAAAAGDATTQACRRLDEASHDLTGGLPGNAGQLKAGFDALTSVRTELPGHDRMADVVLDRFLHALPGEKPCDIAVDTDWLRTRRGNDARTTAVLTRVRPGALVACGDLLLAAGDWQHAEPRYQQALDQFPDSGVTAKATDGVRKAKLAGELANVRALLQTSQYCTEPAAYSGAAPYGKGTNRAVFTGGGDFTGRLPAEWRTDDPAQAVLVVCAGEPGDGTAVRTCPYENKRFPEFPDEVTFHKIAIPVKAYELRTGRLVSDTKIEIGGTSCPEVVHYTSYLYTDLGPPSDLQVEASDADVRAAFAGLVTP